MTRQANATNFWRGFALVSIFRHHIPGIYYERLTHRNLSIPIPPSCSSSGREKNGRSASGRQPQGVVDRGSLVSRLGGARLDLRARILISSIALASWLPRLRASTTRSFWMAQRRTRSSRTGAHARGLVLLTHQRAISTSAATYVCAARVSPSSTGSPGHCWCPLLALYFASSLTVRSREPTWPLPGQWSQA